MKQKLIITTSIMLLLAVIGLMVWDFYYEANSSGNPYEYKLDDLKKVDPDQICYQKEGEIDTSVEGAYALAIDDNDNVYVAGKNRINVFDKDDIEIRQLSISNPATCLALHPSGSIFLGTKTHVDVYDAGGTQIGQWSEINDKVHITGIVVEDESVFVADAGNKIVYHFDLMGQLINKIGEKNKAAGFDGFIIPSPHFDLAIGREGQLWVVNPGKHEFLAFNKNGELFSSWAKTSMQLDGFSGCCNPGNIALISDGSFVTSEKGIERVKIHRPNGDYKCVVAGPEQLSAGCQHFDLAVNSEDQIYVLDTKSGMVKIFEKK